MNRRLIIIGLVALGFFVSLFAAVSCNRQEAPAEVVPTATADPYAADREALVKYSTEFAQKFFTYTRPDNPDYLASIRPYMTEAFFNENKRLTLSEPIALENTTPVTSTVSAAEVESIDASTAEVRVEIQSKTEASQYSQTVYVTWQKTNGRWSATAVRIGTTNEGA